MNKLQRYKERRGKKKIGGMKKGGKVGRKKKKN